MRNLKFISVMLCCLAAVCVTFVSCDDDDDYSGLTPDQRQTAFMSVRGSYNGKLIYPADNPKNTKDVLDTCSASWEILADSVMTIKKFPVSVLGNHITDSVVRKAIQAEQPQDLKCYIGFVNVSPATFLINPPTLTFTVHYGDKDHKIQLPFYLNNQYSFGQRSGKKMQMQIILGAVYADGQITSWLSQGIPYTFISE